MILCSSYRKKKKWELGLAERKEEIIGHLLSDLLEWVLCALLLLLITLTLTVLFGLFSTYFLLDLLEEVLCTLSLLLNYTYFYNYL